MLRTIGIFIIVVGALGACLFAIVNPEAVAWLPYGLFLGLGAAGVFLVQLATRQEATDANALAGQIGDVRESAEELARLSAELQASYTKGEDVYDLPGRIDRDFPGPFGRFVEARESIARLHGVQTYADIMSDFAAGERYLNRVWSAAAEGYIDEADIYLGKAARQLELTRAAVAALPRTASVAPQGTAAPSGA